MSIALAAVLAGLWPPGALGSESEKQADQEQLASDNTPGPGLSAEILGGRLSPESPIGTSVRYAVGLSLRYELGRQLFSPKNWLRHAIQVEAGWLWAPSSSEGTEAVKVTTAYHHLTAAAVAGFPLGLGEAAHLLFYGKIGPGLFLMPVSYEVQGQETEHSGSKLGLIYGLGARLSSAPRSGMGVAARLELVRARRGYLNDLILVAGLGISK
jgi:hypothetical protein